MNQPTLLIRDVFLSPLTSIREQALVQLARTWLRIAIGQTRS